MIACRFMSKTADKFSGDRLLPYGDLVPNCLPLSEDARTAPGYSIKVQHPSVRPIVFILYSEPTDL